MRKRYLSILVLAVALSACQGALPAPVSLTPPVVNQNATTGMLSVEAVPDGAVVSIDGETKGASPLTLELPPGTYDVVVGMSGYASAEDRITLGAGQEAMYAPELADIAGPEVQLEADRLEVPWSQSVTLSARATDNAGALSLELLLDDERLAILEEGELSMTLSPVDTPGMARGRDHVLTARATDASGNVGEANVTVRVLEDATAVSTATPEPERGELTVNATTAPTVDAPTTTAPITDTVRYAVSEITIPTYPYAAYLSGTTDPTLGGYPVRVFDRSAYETGVPSPKPVQYRLLVLENRYLRLELLPDLGGRLYGVTFKPTGSEELYQNAVIKPTAWGPPSPPYPEGVNWWLGAGGMEWGFPVEEHGYEYGTSWGFDNVTTPQGGIMVSLFTRDPNRPHAVVDITLEPGDAFFTLRTRIINPWPDPFRLKWWHNAALAPGPENTVSEGIRFIWPTDSVQVHSTGDDTLAEPGQELSWPIHAGRDLSRLGEWTNYLGLFQSPAAGGGFAAVYDTGSDEGMVRSYPPETARGSKFFASGWQQPLDPALWTDDGTRYVEMQGGLMPTYDDWFELASGDAVDWTETWFPVAGIGGVTHAGQQGAIRVEAQGKQLNLGIFPVRPLNGTISVSLGGAEILSIPVRVSPERPFAQSFDYTGAAVSDEEIRVALLDEKGAPVLEYRGPIVLR